MNARSSHLTIVPEASGKSAENQTPAVQIKDINLIIAQLAQVDADIKALLDGMIGNPYAPVIRFISNTETLIMEKAMADKSKDAMEKWQAALAQLKTNLIIWKEYFGSTVCTLLDANLKTEATRLKNEYPLTDGEIYDITDNILLCTHDLVGKIMGVNTIYDIDTKSGINLDTTKRITNIPEGIKGPLGSLKGTLPQLLIVIKMINLMIAKITLLNIRIILSGIRNLKIDVLDILK